MPNLLTHTPIYKYRYRYESLASYAIYLLGNHTHGFDDNSHTIKRRAVMFIIKSFRQNGMENFENLLKLLSVIDQSNAIYGKSMHSRIVAELLSFELEKRHKPNKANFFGSGEPRLPAQLYMQVSQKLEPILDKSFFESLKGGKIKSSKVKSPGTKRRKSRSPTSAVRKRKQKAGKIKSSSHNNDSFGSQSNYLNSHDSSSNSAAARSPLFQLEKP